MNVQTAQLNRLLREHDNLRAVLDWLLESGELLIGLRLAARLRAFWETRGLAAEGAEWLERLLARAESPRHAGRAGRTGGSLEGAGGHASPAGPFSDAPPRRPSTCWR